jgi:hypothetical protein
LITAKSNDTPITKLLLIEEEDNEPQAHKNALYLAYATTGDTIKNGPLKNMCYGQ